MKPASENDFHPVIVNDPFVQDMMQLFSATIVPGSVKMLEQTMLEAHHEVDVQLAHIQTVLESKLPQAPSQDLFASTIDKPSATPAAPMHAPAPEATPAVPAQPIRRRRKF